jgi:PAS domain S-box-containing protein
MQWFYILYAVLTFILGFATLLLAAYAWQWRRTPGAAIFALLVLMIPGWLFSLGIAMVTSNMDAALWFNAPIRHTFIINVPVIFFIFVLHYTNRSTWLAPKWIALFYLVPVLSMILLWTNPWHHLFFSSYVHYREHGLTLIDEYTPGIWYFVHSAYSYGLLLVVMAILLARAVQSSGPYRGQAALLFIGTLLPVLATIPGVLQVVPGPQLDFAPFGLVAMAFVFSWALFRFGLLDIMPIARDAVIESMEDAVIVLDTQVRVVDLNPAAKAIAGQSSGQVLGRPAEEVFVRWRDVVDKYRDVLKARVEMPLDGGFYDLQISPLYRRNKELAGRLVVLRDITELKRVEEAERKHRILSEQLRDALEKHAAQLEQALAERDQLISELDAFAHTVAHDLKNPLTVLLGYSGLLENGFDRIPADRRQEMLHSIGRTSEKMTSIVNELLLLASVRKREDIALGPLDMSYVVREARERLSQMIAEWQAEVVMPDQWPAAMGYSPWVEEVWANYISNAIKYGGKPPRIELGAGPQPNGTVRFWVRDNGHGLSIEDQRRLFGEFSRLSEGQVEGHGLGLSIVRRIVTKLGGEVGVESQIGQGSMFYFTLPAANQ